MTADADAAPHLRVVRGDPTSAELAAVVAVLAARSAAAAAAPSPEAGPASRSEWASKARLIRQMVPAGPGAWRASASASR